jgi:hypothetical protein
MPGGDSSYLSWKRQIRGVISAVVSDTQTQWANVSGELAAELERWSSVWADLLLVDMILLERRQLRSERSNVFARRGLWESAVIAYGRADQSQFERPVPFKEFVKEVAGDSGKATHDRIMDWRHGHVAHRNSAEFETVETVVEFTHSLAAALKLVIASDVGPANDDPFVAEFENLVKLLRDEMYERRIAPLAAQVAEALGSGHITLPAPGPKDVPSDDRVVITHLLRTL